jgi:hypothetical protein
MDDHKSISRVIRSFSIGLNDGIKDDELRTRLLRPYITKILGTATTSEDETARLAGDRLAGARPRAGLPRSRRAD